MRARAQIFVLEQSFPLDFVSVTVPLNFVSVTGILDATGITAAEGHLAKGSLHGQLVGAASIHSGAEGLYEALKDLSTQIPPHKLLDSFLMTCTATRCDCPCQSYQYMGEQGLCLATLHVKAKQCMMYRHVAFCTVHPAISHNAGNKQCLLMCMAKHGGKASLQNFQASCSYNTSPPRQERYKLT